MINSEVQPKPCDSRDNVLDNNPIADLKILSLLSIKVVITCNFLNFG